LTLVFFLCAFNFCFGDNAATLINMNNYHHSNCFVCNSYTWVSSQDDYYYWNNGTYYFSDPLPSRDILLGGAKITLYGSWGCGASSYANVAVYLSGNYVGSNTLYGDCNCNNCNYPYVFYTNYIYYYNYGSNNTISLFVNNGTIRLSSIVVELNYTFNTQMVTYKMNLGRYHSCSICNSNNWVSSDSMPQISYDWNAGVVVFNDSLPYRNCTVYRAVATLRGIVGCSNTTDWANILLTLQGQYLEQKSFYGYCSCGNCLTMNFDSGYNSTFYYYKPRQSNSLQILLQPGHGMALATVFLDVYYRCYSLVDKVQEQRHC